LFNFTNI